MNPSQTISFGERLARLREETGLTQEQTAAELKKRGVSVSMRALAGYERGERAPTEVKQASILRELGNIADNASVETGKGDLVETGRFTYLQLIGPEGRVMLEVEMVIKATTKPHQIPLDVKTGLR